MKWFARISLIAAATVLLATDLPAQRRFNPRTVIPRPFPALTEFPVVVGKEPRAYPINMLTGPRREILNDTLGGKAIAATW